jgi:IMP dehydrogenase
VPEAGLVRNATGSCRDAARGADFLKVSPAALRESHVHDVITTKEAPNYQIE